MRKFEKVSYKQFKEAALKNFPNLTESELKDYYDAIKLPRRATKYSAGYDFYIPWSIELHPGDTVTIPTGIAVDMDGNNVLQIYPRSGLGFKYRIRLDNTVGIIDADYRYSDNEGHILIKITNLSTDNKTAFIEQGKGFAQGIFSEYLVTDEDDVTDIRNGGFGSTTNSRHDIVNDNKEVRK